MEALEKAVELVCRSSEIHEVCRNMVPKFLCHAGDTAGRAIIGETFFNTGAKTGW